MAARPHDSVSRGDGGAEVARFAPRAEQRLRGRSTRASIRFVAGVDVILSGHTHHRLYTPVVNGTIIMQSGAHGSYVGRLDLETSVTGIVDWHHQLIEIDDATEPDSGMHAVVRDEVAPFTTARQTVLGATGTPLTRYAMLESTMDHLLLAAIAASADLPIALSNGWRDGAPIPAGPLPEMDVWRGGRCRVTTVRQRLRY